MKNEEVIRILENAYIQVVSPFADEEYCGQAFNIAIDVLKRIDADKIQNIMGECYPDDKDTMSRAIVNYLLGVE